MARIPSTLTVPHFILHAIFPNPDNFLLAIFPSCGPSEWSHSGRGRFESVSTVKYLEVDRTQGDDTSPASFERILSNLSSRITKKSRDLDRLRQRSRRYGLLWIVYTTFLYLLYSTILLLVVGWRNWGLAEYSAVLGGPVV